MPMWFGSSDGQEQASIANGQVPPSMITHIFEDDKLVIFVEF